MKPESRHCTPPLSWWRLGLFLVPVAVLVLAAPVLGLGDRLAAVREWLAGLGHWAPLAYVLVFVTAAVAAVPGSALTMMGGVLFGSFWGILLAHTAATMAAALAFLLGRYLAREAVERRLSGSARFRRLLRLTAEHGAIIVALTRLVPILPFSLLNYGFSLTRVPFLPYLFWSWLCLLPGIAFYVVGADAVVQVGCQGRVPGSLAVLLVVVLAGLGWLAAAARRRLAAREQGPPARTHPGD